MKTHTRFSIVVVLMIVCVSNVIAQNQDSIAIKKTIDNTGNADQKQNTKVIFKSFDFETKENIKPAGGININNVFIVAEGSGEIKLYLSKHKYFVLARFVGWMDTKSFKFKIDPKYNYTIEIYLTHSKEPITLAN